MIPMWFRDMVFIFLGILVTCGTILAVIVMAAIIKAVIDEKRKGGDSQRPTRS